ncbi:hypothetical protein LZ32DRAFT_599295 [Colletotrichum eremochloae]|nr:hypothetical protein LZ32DRAFT_599295 [Colletotrichum eremochloae]
MGPLFVVVKLPPVSVGQRFGVRKRPYTVITHRWHPGSTDSVDYGAVARAVLVLMLMIMLMLMLLLRSETI